MLINLILSATICYVTGYTYQTEKPFLLKLTPEQVMQTFDGVMSDEYIKILAKDFATKAAAHFMNEIRNQKNALIARLNKQRDDEQDRIPSKPKEYTETEMDTEAEIDTESETEISNEKDDKTETHLDEREAFRLLQAPSPDGDHLESSGEFSDKEDRKIPVIQVTKINGKYYRRLLGMI